MFVGCLFTIRNYYYYLLVIFAIQSDGLLLIVSSGQEIDAVLGNFTRFQCSSFFCSSLVSSVLFLSYFKLRHGHAENAGILESKSAATLTDKTTGSQ